MTARILILIAAIVGFRNNFVSSARVSRLPDRMATRALISPMELVKVNPMARLNKYKATSGDFLIRDFIRRIEKQKTYLKQGKEQFVHFQLAHLYAGFALTQYGLGRDYSEVVASLRMAVESFLTVFRLKGTTPDGRIRHLGKHQNAERPREQDTFTPDYGYTNSKESLFGIAMALLSNRLDAAKEIAMLAGNPPHISLPNDRFLESAFKAFFVNDDPEIARQLGLILVGDDRWYEHMRDGFRALVARSSAQYASAVEEMVVLHGQEAVMDFHKHDPLYNLCFHMMGLAVLAVLKQILPLKDIPDRPPYFPRDLIGYVLTQ